MMDTSSSACRHQLGRLEDPSRRVLFPAVAAATVDDVAASWEPSRHRQNGLERVLRSATATLDLVELFMTGLVVCDILHPSVPPTGSVLADALLGGQCTRWQVQYI